MFWVTQISEKNKRYTLQMLLFQNPQLVGSLSLYIFCVVLRSPGGQL